MAGALTASEGSAADSSRATLPQPKTSADTQRDAPLGTQVTGGARGQREVREFARSGGPVS